jgi:hypothetical protein
VRSVYGAGVEAFNGLGELYIRSCIVGIDISTEGRPVFRRSTMSRLGSRCVTLSAWKVLC